MVLKKLKGCGFSGCMLMLALLLVGGFHEYISCALSAAMCIYLLLRLGKGEGLRIRKDLLTSAVIAISLGYGLTCLWAVDSGVALVGFVKFLPLVLYLVCLQQQEDTETTLQVLPYYGAVLTVLSVIGMRIPGLQRLFEVSDRLAGTFQYPNTFALFLLVCQLLLWKKTPKKIWDYVTIAVLLAGLLYTGSRTVFVVAILANIGMLFVYSKKRGRNILLIGMAAAVLVGVILLSGSSVLRRYLSISLTESTFVGRLLYWVDALPLLLRYPFGMGYKGYFYIQQSVQTGVYSVAYIHNELLQLLLDVGVVPVGLFIWALIRWMLQKTTSAADRIIVGAVCLHSFFDFNMQFVSMFMLLLLLIGREPEVKTKQIKASWCLKGSLAVTGAVVLYLGVALMLSHLGANQVADALYPYNTQNTLTMLEQESDLEQANELADRILKQNTDYYAPYLIKIKHAYSQGNFALVITYAHAIFEKSPFTYMPYEQYAQMLINGIGLYEKVGDTTSANICRQELQSIPALLASNRERQSQLGKKIVDQPVTWLPDSLLQQIEQLGGAS